MAGGGVGVAASSPVKTYNSKVTVFVVMSCIVAATGGLLFGYDIGISGGVSQMPDFLQTFFKDVLHKAMRAKMTDYCKFESAILTAFTSSLYIAGLFSSMLASGFTRRFGRKFSMLAGAACFLVGAGLDGGAVNVEMLILGRIMLGFGVGFANQAVPIYLSEVSPPGLRGAFNVGFMVFVGIGVLIANIINYETSQIKESGWRISLGLAGVPALIMFVGILPLPDTPSSLIERGRNDEAKSILQKLRGTPDVQEELADIKNACEHARSMDRNALSKILQKKNRPQLIVALSIQVLQQFSGIGVIAFYSPVLFRTIGFESNAALMSAVIFGVVNLVSTGISIAVIDRMGRRKLLMHGALQMLVCQVAIGVILAKKLEENKGLSKEWGITLVVLMSLYGSGFVMSWGPLSWMVASEIFPLEVRSAGQSLSVATQLLVTFILAQFFLEMLCKMKYGIFLFYAGWGVVMWLFAFLLMPETKNLPIEDMFSIWREHWFWRKVVPRSEDEEEIHPPSSMF